MHSLLYNTAWYMYIEQDNSWLSYQNTVMDAWRDVFMVQAAWRNRHMWAQPHMPAVASINSSALDIYRGAMSERAMMEITRYGGHVL